jgi:hypothetical protein
MARPKNGQLAQFQVPMVDSVDFASIESAITASDFNSGATVKFYGHDQGVSTATTSGTVSKTASLVRSGVFRITLKTTENNYDAMTLRVNKTGCAEQIIQWDNETNDDSDIVSLLTIIQSAASDAASAATQANSRVLLNQSRISDIYSLLSDLDSNFQSRVPKETAARSQLSDLASDLASDIKSNLLLHTSTLSDIQSVLLLHTSSFSDLQSALSDAHSDLASKIGAITVTISASDVSDIASAVVAGLPITSTISDIYSLLSDLNSNFQSRVPKETAARSQLSDLSSDMVSDLRSFIGAGVPLDASSLSDIRSAITAAEFDASDVSDIASRVTAVLASDLSDIYSAATQINSRVLLNQSRISDVASYLVALSGAVSDIESQIDAGIELGASSLSDLRSAIAATELDASDLSDIASAVWVRAGSDPATVPAVNAGMGAKLDWLTAMSRNKITQTSSVQSLRNDADAADIASAALSFDAGTSTLTRGEFA